MTVVDSSVAVAAFASWHEQHAAADRTVAGGVRLIAHCAVETFSVLTRLPPPHRARAELVRDFLAARFPEEYIGLDTAGHRALLSRLTELGITGGAAYDALVAATAAAADATLISCDRRAAATYERFGVGFRLLAT
jgi:predicted nucleic acid-binding protein